MHVTYRRVLDWMIGFIDTLYTPLGTTGNYSAIAISTLYSSLLHYCPQSSLVVSWQRIHNSFTVTAAHYEVFFAQPNSFLAIILPTSKSEDSFNYLLQLPTPELNSVPSLRCLRSSLFSLGAAPRENTASSIVAC
jgi:hypothetical protein